MNKLNLKMECLFCLLVLVMCFVTGCSDEKVIGESAVSEMSVVSVDFADETSSSRFLVDSLEAIYKPEDLFWMYTAEKVGEVYSMGETRDASGALVKTPVSAGNLRGLAGYPKKFSTGTWTFNVYGYLDQAHTATKLVYSGKREKVVIEANTDGTAKTPVVGFELKTEETYNKGMIDFGPIVVTVPEDKAFASGNVIKMKVLYVNGSSKTECATATKTLDKAYNPGDLIVVDSFTWSTSVTNNFAPGDLELIFRADCNDSDFLGDYSYKTKVAGGMVTVVEGNMGDLGGMVASTGSITAGNFVAYKTLKEAIAANKSTVSVWQDINDAGTMSLPAGVRNVDVFTRNHYINNISFSDSDSNRYIAFFPAGSASGEGWMTFRGGTLSINDTGTDVYISTSGDNCEIGVSFGVNRCNVVRHIGTLKKLTLTNGPNNESKNWGYCFDGVCTEEIVTNAGWLKLGPNANVEKLDLHGVSAAGRVKLTGNTSTVIKNIVVKTKRSDGTLSDETLSMAEIRDDGITSKDNSKGHLTDIMKSIFIAVNTAADEYQYFDTGTNKYIKSTGSFSLYGIEGMFMDLPLFVDSARNDSCFQPSIFMKLDKAFLYWKDENGMIYKDAEKRALIVSNGKTLTPQWLDYGVCITAEEAGVQLYTMLTCSTAYGVGKYNDTNWPHAKLQYSTDFGASWRDYVASIPSSDGATFTNGETITLENIGDKVIFKAKSRWSGGCSFVNYGGRCYVGECMFSNGKKHTVSGTLRAFYLPASSDRYNFIYGDISNYAGGAAHDWPFSFFMYKNPGVTVTPYWEVYKSGDVTDFYESCYRLFSYCDSLRYAYFCLTPEFDLDGAVSHLGNVLTQSKQVKLFYAYVPKKPTSDTSFVFGRMLDGVGTGYSGKKLYVHNSVYYTHTELNLSTSFSSITI